MLGVGSGGPTAVAGPPVAAAAGVDSYASERDAWVVLTAVDRVGPIAFAAMLAAFGNGRQILAVASGPSGVERLMATPPLDRSGRQPARRPVSSSLATSIADAAQRGAVVLERVRSLGLRTVTIEEPAYPHRLGEIAMPPHVLFVQGDLTAADQTRAVAVVGTRRPTTSGRVTAGRIAAALVHAQSAVISGLAYGIDGAAHEAAVQAGGRTVAVIGGGHGAGVPRGHGRLAGAIVGSGGAIVSEHAPNVQPTHGTFPRRNRLISGLAAATIVVEAPARSGALLTASWALEQGRECYLVPGGLDAPASSGCLAFLREFHDSARLVAGIPQLIADLGYASPADRSADQVSAAAVQGLGTTAGRVASALIGGLATIDEVVAATDLPVATVLAALSILQDRGLVVGRFGRYRPAGALLGEPERQPLR
jgi:DNA processing protein